MDEHHVHVYASKDNRGTIVKAPRPVDLFRNSIATPSLVASIINGKYVNALPLDRQSKAFQCNGVHLTSNTMANWMIKGSEDYLSLLYDRLHHKLYDNPVIHADESPVKVMRIENLLTEIPKHMGDKNLDFLEELLPWNPKIQKECASHLKKS